MRSYQKFILAQDAKALAELLDAPQQRRIYEDVEVLLLVDGDVTPPTQRALLDGLKWLRQEAVLPDDVAVLFISSHGMAAGDANVRRPKDLLILPTDADPADPLGTAVTGQTLIESLKDVPGHILVIIDACYAGGVTLPDTNRFALDAASPWAGMFVFASSSYDQPSREDSVGKHGVFTEALLEALRGQNGMRTLDGTIITDYLASYLARRVPQLSGAQQKPLFASPPQAPDLRAFAVAN